MSVKGKLLLVIFGLILIPVFISFIFIWLLLSQDGGDIFSNNIKTMRYLKRNLPRIESEGFSVLDNIPEESLFLIYSRSTDEILYNHLGKMHFESLQDLLYISIRDEKTRVEIFDISDIISDISIIFIFRNTSASPFSRDPIFIPIIGFSMIFFAVVLFIIIIRGIKMNLNRLGIEARRIASGDLSHQIHLPGSDEFASMAHTLEDMRIKLKEEYARKNRFLMSISHDLKTPLSSIEGYLDAIQDGFANTEEKRKEYLEIIRQKSYQLGHRITTLVDFAKLSTEESNYQKTSMNLKKTLLEISEIFNSEADVTGFYYTSIIDLPEEIFIKTQRDLFFRLLENLFNNAMKYNDYRKEVHMESNLQDDTIIIKMINTGKGISLFNRDLVFEAFFRESKTRNKDGFGLGLTSAKSIIDSHGWSITIEDIPEKKIAFVIAIPKNEILC